MDTQEPRKDRRAERYPFARCPAEDNEQIREPSHRADERGRAAGDVEPESQRIPQGNCGSGENPQASHVARGESQ